MGPITYIIDLTGRTAVVTGGSGTIGAAIVATLAQAGAAVAVLGRRAEAAEAVAAGVVALGGRAVAVAADVRDRASLERAHARVLTELGPVSILVNGAGGNSPDAVTDVETLTTASSGRGFFDLDDQAIRSAVELNLLGTVLSTQVFAAEMTGSGGSVVNISSMNAYRPLTRIPAYSAAKAAVSNLTAWLAVHLAPAGVRVNAVAPGFVAAEQNRGLLFEADGSLGARGRKAIAATPMRRLATPQEVAGCVLFLCCDALSGFVTGTVIPVDGGFSAYSGV